MRDATSLIWLLSLLTFDAACGSGGARGAAAVPCPVTPPQPGTSCTAGMSCYYEDCAGAGRTIATCANTGQPGAQWTVATSDCTIVFCSTLPYTCARGQVCIVREGATATSDCVGNSCGASAISCGCIQSCQGDCTVVGTSQSGVTIYCNTCPSGMTCG